MSHYRQPCSHPIQPNARIGVILMNFGSPDAPTAAATRPYLARFLSDPRVVELPAWKWQPILRGIILNTRPAKSAEKYHDIWTSEGSPLVAITRVQVAQLQRLLNAHQQQHGGVHFRVAAAMRYSSPYVADVLDELRQDGCERFLIVPLFPQYAASSTGSAFDEVFRYGLTCRNVPEFRFVRAFFREDFYIAALAQHIENHWKKHGRGDHLLLSFHGIPRASILQGDPYFDHCTATSLALAEKLKLDASEYTMAFQSRFGREEWLKPYVTDCLNDLAKSGKSLDVICPGFVSDCLETLEEIAMDAQSQFLKAGGKAFQYIPCLNSEPMWLDALAQLVLKHTQGWDAF